MAFRTSFGVTVGWVGLFATGVVTVACGRTVGIGSDQDDAAVRGCSGGAAFCDQSDADVNPDGGTLVDGAPVPPASDGVVACPFGLSVDAGSTSTRTYARSCSSPADCAIAYHREDCCGTERALGVSVSEKSRFVASGGICGDVGPLCSCPALLPLAADDERSTKSDHSDIDVRCVEGACEAYVTTFACGDQSCDSRTQYCDALTPGIALADGGTPPIFYTCKNAPAACAAAPTCACIAPTFPGATCVEPKGRVSVTRMGI
jgi:hypothetical protein